MQANTRGKCGGWVIAATAVGFLSGWGLKPTPAPVERIVTREVMTPAEKTITVEVPVDRAVYVALEREPTPHPAQCVLTQVGT